MAKRANSMLWWLGAILAGVLLIAAVLLCVWSVNKQWLPGCLDLWLRGVSLVYAYLGAAASVLLMVNLWAASRGQYHWHVDGLASAAILLVLWAILWPTTFRQPPPAAYANFEGRNLQGALLGSYNFALANLRHANLTNAALDHASFRGANLTGTTLADANLNHAWLFHARAAGTNLSRANLEHAVLSAANLHGALLHHADLRNARLNDLGKLYGTTIRGSADLRNADLTGADLRGANLDGAILTGARYDAHTRWPAGFNPAMHGAKLSQPPAAGRLAILM